MRQIPAVIFLLLVPVIVFLGSCDQNRVFEENTRIPDGIWSRENIISFELVIEDTISPHNLYVNVRNTTLYPMSNLHIIITTTAPSGDSIEERIEVKLADDKGKWLGSGLGDIFDIQQRYKTNIRFAQRGKYSFLFEQGMRVEHLPFIMDVGLRVEKSE